MTVVDGTRLDYRSALARKKRVDLFNKNIGIRRSNQWNHGQYGLSRESVGAWKEAEIFMAKGEKDELVPVGRPGTGGDVARVITFLCENQSDFITGSVIPITGGSDILGKINKK